VLQQRVENQVQRLPVLVWLAVRQGEQVHRGIDALQGGAQALGVQGRDGGVGHDQRR
jgi:hypothetical protein